MKRIISFLLILCTLFSVCSCTKSNVLDEETALPSVQEQEKEATDSEIKQQEQTDKEQSNKEQSDTENTKQEQNTQNDNKQENSNNDYEDEPIYEESGSIVESEEGMVISTGGNETVDEYGLITSAQKWLEIDFPIKDIIDCVSMTYHTFMVITKNYELYYISLDKPFSNNKCYLKIDTNLKFNEFVEMMGPANASSDEYKYYFVSTDGKIYSAEEFKGYDTSYNTNLAFNDVTQELKEKNITSKYIYVNNGAYYENNKIYSLEGKELYSFPQGENIEKVFYDFVKTKNGFYKIKFERFQEFADSEWEEKMVVEFIEGSENYTICYISGYGAAIPK